ncbi:MAG TPA: chemotaxis protein CheA [Opitutaceae bacterium]|nr:chemotaxis protein CheA [Opitutaceae bacterium]
MSLIQTPDSTAAADEIINRLAAESMLATAGRDDGLVPAYSLINELIEHCLGREELGEPTKALKVELERYLDNALPFDEPLLARLRGFVEWFPAAASGETTQPAPGAALPTAAQGAPPAASHEKPPATDVLLDLNMSENAELLGEFYAEAVDHLQQIEAALLVLDQQPDNSAALNDIFRSFHTIKGNAGFLGLVPMHTLAHEVESLLDLARNHELRLNPAIITEILRSRDALQALVQQVGRTLEKGQLPDRVIPVSHLIRAVKELAASRGASGGEAANAAAPVASADAANAGSPQPADEAPVKAAASATVRVNTEKLDSLMDVVGELVIVQSQLVESARAGGEEGSPLQRNISQLTRISKDLQHTAMSLRMIPIKSIFQKMERLARDLAREMDKKVHFQTSGEDTELDRTVVEEIGDPLVHMVRNALDHGLDTTAERIARGKPETGVVHLSAYHRGSNIIIELSDDGRGIDPDKILRKAVEKGVVAPGAALSREETLALILAPGFSTAEKVTAVSGRGVGMDVVRRNIEKLRGKIEIESEVGKGSTFRIKLPLTMAIIDGLVVRVGEDRFILPSTSVLMALRPAREHIVTVHGTGEVLDFRGRILPLHRLHRRFGIPGAVEKPWDAIVVIVEHSGKKSALLVDEMISKQEVVIKSLGAYLQGLPGVAGGAILGDGNIALILDPGALLQAA